MARFFFWLIFFWLIMIYATLVAYEVIAQEIPQEPPLYEMSGWDSHKSIGVIVTFGEGFNATQYAHPSYAVEYCNDCPMIAVRIDEPLAYLLADGGRVFHVISTTPTHFKMLGDVFWLPMIQKTYPLPSQSSSSQLP